MKRILLLVQCLLISLAFSACETKRPVPNLAVEPSASSSDASVREKPSVPATPNISAEFISLNQMFLDGYKERRAAVKASTSPIIVADFRTLKLRWSESEETAPALPDIYHSLKAIAHLPFGIFLRVDPYAKDQSVSLPPEILSELKMYQERIAAAEQALPQGGFTAEQSKRQQEILRASKDFISDVLRDSSVSRAKLLAFTHAIGPKMLANADDAARAQIDLMHAHVMKWKKAIPAPDWNRLVVVVRGFQMPRRMYIETQYFAKLLNEPSHNLGYPLESRRLIYAEFIRKDLDHLDLMATTFIDGDASEAFFGDRWRMSRDVLADGAEEYLKTLRFD
jgi:hypothetical protein